jgi:REP element-mobilizing transposase RayT
MDRYWLLTSTFYGNWLPGDRRGFVSRVREIRADDPWNPQTRGADATPLQTRGADATPLARHEHDIPGTLYDEDMPGLSQHAQEQLTGESIRINREHAQVLLAQFQETAAYRGWQIRAVAIMCNHFHLVVGVTGDPEPTKVLGDFKAYGSRALNRRWGKPRNGSWWTYDGSKRKLGGEQALLSAIEYVRNQPGALVVWIAAD